MTNEYEHWRLQPQYLCSRTHRHAVSHFNWGLGNAPRNPLAIEEAAPLISKR